MATSKLFSRSVNAIDDAGVDVLREGATLLGPLGEALLRVIDK
jgi:hypothetical protein